MGWMILLLLLGLILVCLEIFIPGGIVGTLGAFALIASVVLGFTVREGAFGMYWLIGVLLLTLLAVFLSIRYLPHSPAGKRLFLNSSESGYSSSDERIGGLLNARGKAISDLRPSGLADIGDQRVDVVTGGEFLPRGTEVEVIDVSGNRVVVRKIPEKQEDSESQDKETTPPKGENTIQGGKK